MNKATKAGVGPMAFVKHFRIYKDDVEADGEDLLVFNNSRQQCVINVRMIVTDKDNTIVELKDPDFRERLTLIDYYEDTELPADYACSFDKNDYVWDENIISDAAKVGRLDVTPRKGAPRGKSHDRDEEPGVTYYSCKLYVSSKAASNSRIKIAAKFKISDNVYYTTNTDDIEDTVGDGNGEGEFNSGVHLRSIAFPALPEANFGDISTDGTLIPHAVGTVVDFYKVREHNLHVRLNGTNLPLKSISATPGGSDGFSIYDNGVGSTASWGISYFLKPGSTGVSHFPLPPVHKLNILIKEGEEPKQIYDPVDMLTKCVPNIANPDPKKAVIGMLSGTFDAVFVNTSGGVVPARSYTEFYLRDVYGNDHHLSIGFAGGVDKIQLNKLG